MVKSGLHVPGRAKQESNTFQGKQTPTVTENVFGEAGPRVCTFWSARHGVQEKRRKKHTSKRDDKEKGQGWGGSDRTEALCFSAE